MFENLRGGRQARNFTADVPKILDLKSPSEQIFSKNWRWVPLMHLFLVVFLELFFFCFPNKKSETKVLQKSLNAAVHWRKKVATMSGLLYEIQHKSI